MDEWKGPKGCPGREYGGAAAGRCLSASHQAHAAVRSIGQCMAMGQGAGTAAALALDAGCDVRDLDMTRLRDVLLADRAILREG